MNIVAAVLLAIFALVHAAPMGLAFKEHKIPLLNLGLCMLGALNILVGIVMATRDVTLGALAAGIGVISIDIAAILNGYTLNETGPNWVHHGVRAGISVFLVGLLALYS
ncbi:MAG: hypothetical protein BroJett018_32150 [Chloroflexota bacterium]|nr:hypothetical protein [Chloroflexota bacterium]NOG65996.1 hypothetical protein [Chloroflexota bacterium]GIK65421.1 MAG: hypothetical protein BroJett018_32150 [Chloroflexota bacterium]